MDTLRIVCICICTGTDEPLTCTRSRSPAFFSPISPRNLLLISNLAHLTIEVFACFYFACHYNNYWSSPIFLSFVFFLSFSYVSCLVWNPGGPLCKSNRNAPHPIGKLSFCYKLFQYKLKKIRYMHYKVGLIYSRLFQYNQNNWATFEDLVNNCNKIKSP